MLTTDFGNLIVNLPRLGGGRTEVPGVSTTPPDLPAEEAAAKVAKSIEESYGKMCRDKPETVEFTADKAGLFRTCVISTRHTCRPTPGCWRSK